MTDPAASPVLALLGALGAPLDDPELARTPERVAALWRDNLLAGQGVDPAELLADPIPDAGGAVITLTGLPFHCVCPHHLLPTYGVVHLAYEPDGAIVGFGAIERLVHALSRRLTLQETFTAALVDALMTHLGARGAAVAVEATHLCLILQGREPRTARVHTRLARGTLQGRSDILPPVHG